MLEERDDGWVRFNSPLAGGFDGLDIQEVEPFRNAGMTAATLATNYALNTLREGVSIVSDPEAVACNIITVPGITNDTRKMMNQEDTIGVSVNSGKPWMWSLA